MPVIFFNKKKQHAGRLWIIQWSNKKHDVWNYIAALVTKNLKYEKKHAGEKPFTRDQCDFKKTAKY